MHTFAWYFGCLNIGASLLTCLPGAYAAASKNGEAGTFWKYLIPVLSTYAVIIYPAYQLPQLDSFCIIVIMLICGSMVTQCWKYIISSVLKFNFNPFTLDSFLPLIVIEAAIIFPEYGSGLLMLGALGIWIYNIVFFISNISQISKGINVQVF